MTATQDLIERLERQPISGNEALVLIHEAAARLRDQEAELAALRAERADIIKINNKWAQEWDAMREERDALREVVEAAKAMRGATTGVGYTRLCAELDAALAKVK